MTPFFAETAGTLIMILLGNGIVANVLLRQTKGHGAGWLAITTGWALAVFCGVVVAAPYSGAHLNPAVSLGLAAAGRFEWASVPLYISAQMLGAALGSGLVWIFYRNHYALTEDPEAIRATFCTIPAVRDDFSNFMAELTAIFVLIFSVFYISDGSVAVSGREIPVELGLGSVGALPVAFIVWAIGLSLGGTTGYAINPARDAVPRLMHSLLPIRHKGSSEWGYAWIPVSGPLAGALLAAGLYRLLSAI